MKKIGFILILFCLVSMSLRAQNIDSINTETKKLFIDTLYSWDNLVVKAQKENKYIYLFYHHPQFRLDYELKRQFLNTASKKFFVNNFIIVDVEAGYSDNRYYKTIVAQNFIDSLKKSEHLNDVTMNLIYNKDGKMMSKFNFNFEYVDDKIKHLKEVLKGKYDYYKLLKQYNEGNRNADFIREFYRTYKGTVYYFREDTLRIFEEFLKAYPHDKLFTKTNGKLVYEYSNYIYDEFSKNLMQNRKKWYKAIGKTKVDNKLINFLSDDFFSIQDDFWRKSGFGAFYEIYAKYKKEYPDFSDYDSSVFLNAKVKFFYEKEIYDSVFPNLSIFYKNADPENESRRYLSGITWLVYKNVSEKKLLLETLKWCKKKIPKMKDHYCLDPYANLLYKLGYKRKAIQFEEKAISYSKEEKYISIYRSNINKMKNNEPTW